VLGFRVQGLGLKNLFKLGAGVGVQPPSLQLVLMLQKFRLVHLLATTGYEPSYALQIGLVTCCPVAVSTTQSLLGIIPFN